MHEDRIDRCAEESDEGNALRELRDLEQASTRDFFKRVQRSIYRRSSAAQFAVFACELSPGLALEFGQMVAHAMYATAVPLQRLHSQKGGTTDGETKEDEC